MKLRLPLFSRILLWFFLNLALLTIGFALLLRSQFVLDRDFLLSAGAVDRLQTLGDQIAGEIQNQTETEQSAILSRYNSTYRVRFHVFDENGRPFDGEPSLLPPEVHDRVARHRPPPDLLPPPPGEDQPALPPEPNNHPPNPLRTLIRAGNPSHYWAVIRTSSRLMVAVESDSLTGHGLFFDLRPWLVAVFGAAVFSALFWLPFVRGITRSVAQMTQATQQIAEGRFDVRVDARRGDELGALGQAVNSMAQRLDGFVTGQKRFLGDTAHELCSPLARLRVALGILEERVDAARQPDVARANEQAEEIAGLVNELLSFSKASLGAARIKLEAVSLQGILDTAARRETADGSRIEVNVPADLRAQAEPELLTRAVANLLRNAVRYAGANSPITIAAEQRDGNVMVTVADQGPGIPEDELQRIFDPFYRLDASRDRQTGGVGLGLAIVKTCVEACQGTVVAANRTPHGLQVTITLRA
jgi:two-component system, OmpR family, sensor histidine kinase CpxA